MSILQDIFSFSVMFSINLLECLSLTTVKRLARWRDTEMYSTQVGSNLTCKHYTRSKMLARVKHSLSLTSPDCRKKVFLWVASLANFENLPLILFFSFWFPQIKIWHLKEFFCSVIVTCQIATPYYYRSKPLSSVIILPRKRILIVTNICKNYTALMLFFGKKEWNLWPVL